MFEWVKGIVFYLILLTVVSHLLPGHKYDKYVRLFTGMLLIMIVIRPITHLFSWDSMFDKNFLDISGAWADSGLDEDFMQDLEGMQARQLQEEYVRQTEQFVKKQAEGYGLTVTQCKVRTEWREDVIYLTSLQLEIEKSSSEQLSADQAEKFSSQGSADGVDESSQQGSSGVSKPIDEVSIADVVLGEQGQDEDTYAQFRSALANYYGVSEESIQIRGHG